MMLGYPKTQIAQFVGQFSQFYGFTYGSFGINALPSLLFFKNGEVKDQVIGSTTKKDLVSRIEALG